MLNKLNVIERDNRVRDYILPAAIVSEQGDMQNVETLLEKKELQIFLQEQNLMTVKSGFIVLDFGKELQGGVRILTHGLEGNCRVRLRFGESLSETYSEVIGKNDMATATNDHSLRDFTVGLTALSDMQFGQTGFRFLRLDFDCEKVVTIKSIVGVFEHRNLKRLGFFTCSDERINEIFETAVYTVELCMQNMLWDGIKRDRLVWVGDIHPEMMTIMSIFSEDNCIEQAIERSAKHAPLPGWINTMPAYSLWWLLILGDYYFHTGKLSFLQRNREYILELLAQIDRTADSFGNIVFPAYFLDWATNGAEAAKAGVYALCDIAMEKSKLVLNALGEDTNVCDRILNRTKKTLAGGKFKQIVAFQVLADHCDRKNAYKMLINGGAKGLSSFMSYYILSAIAECSGTSDALNMMKSYYGGMLDMGATTFWEEFNVDWLNGSCRIDELAQVGQTDIHGDFGGYCYRGYRHSLCHGWSSGCVPFIVRYIMGIKEIAVGCKRVEIKPNLCGLKFANCVYPTPYGEIKVQCTDNHGKIETVITAPREIEIIR